MIPSISHVFPMSQPTTCANYGQIQGCPLYTSCMERMYHPAGSWFGDYDCNHHLLVRLGLPKENRRSEDCPRILRNPMQYKSWGSHHHVACGPPRTPGQSSLILFSFEKSNSIHEWLFQPKEDGVKLWRKSHERWVLPHRIFAEAKCDNASLETVQWRRTTHEWIVGGVSLGVPSRRKGCNDMSANAVIVAKIYRTWRLCFLRIFYRAEMEYTYPMCLKGPDFHKKCWIEILNKSWVIKWTNKQINNIWIYDSYKRGREVGQISPHPYISVRLQVVLCLSSFSFCHLPLGSWLLDLAAGSCWD